MQWNDEGYLLSKNNYSENSVIIEVFTLNHGKCSGIVYGGTSRKIKNYLQLGNKIYVNLKTKNESKLGYFKIEIIDPISPFFFDDNKKINCLFSSLNLLKIVLPEMQSYNSIYILFSNFLNKLKFSNNWIVHYIFWEMNLLKKIGFDMNLTSNYVSGPYNKKKIITVNIDNENINVPSFMVDKKFYNIDTKSIYYALTFIGKFLKKNVLIPNNLNYPISRIKLENYFR
jgi:DNA repair protein RecO (recombination protein O)